MDPGLCRPSRRVRIQHWKRDPCVDRALAWEAAGREVHRAALSHREGGRPRRPRDLRELSVDGIPAAPVPRLRVVQRVPGIRRSLEDYLARLHSLSEDHPVLLSEIGLDSLRNGEETQAAMLSGQVRAAFRVGCAGVIVFAWTDEWYHGKFRVEDWAFGLTTRNRTP